jgi:GNAT superfamily N-acetyltransferase
MQLMHINEPIIGVWALDGNQLMGITLTTVTLQQNAEIFSFFVVPPARNKTLGKQLLTITEKTLNELGIKQVMMRFRDDWGSHSFISKLLLSSGWEDPAIIRIIAELEIKRFPEMTWPNVKLPGDIKIINWNERNKQDDDYLSAQIANQQVGTVFNPYQNPERIYPSTSLLMRYNEKIIGWCISYQMKAGTIEYNNLFVFNDFRNKGYAIKLIELALAAQHLKTTIPYATWIINAQNNAILRVFNQVGKPHVHKLISVKASRKQLS